MFFGTVCFKFVEAEVCTFVLPLRSPDTYWKSLPICFSSVEYEKWYETWAAEILCFVGLQLAAPLPCANIANIDQKFSFFHTHCHPRYQFFMFDLLSPANLLSSPQVFSLAATSSLAALEVLTALCFCLTTPLPPPLKSSWWKVLFASTFYQT